MSQGTKQIRSGVVTRTVTEMRREARAYREIVEREQLVPAVIEFFKGKADGLEHAARMMEEALGGELSDKPVSTLFENVR